MYQVAVEIPDIQAREEYNGGSSIGACMLMDLADQAIDRKKLLVNTTSWPSIPTMQGEVTMIYD